MTERERMIAGEMYRPDDAELTALRRRARRLTRSYNATTEDEDDLRRTLLGELFERIGSGAVVEPPFHLDYGVNLRVGDHFYANFGCVILDVCPVTIGDDAMLAPGVHLYAATHPLDAAQRASGRESGGPISIGNRVWIGGGSIVLPNVTIGDDAVIGAGSVVTRNVPPGVVVVGNPARISRHIGQ